MEKTIIFFIIFICIPTANASVGLTQAHKKYKEHAKIMKIAAKNMSKKPRWSLGQLQSIIEECNRWKAARDSFFTLVQENEKMLQELKRQKQEIGKKILETEKVLQKNRRNRDFYTIHYSFAKKVLPGAKALKKTAEKILSR